jgi:hypothetical protein
VLWLGLARLLLPNSDGLDSSTAALSPRSVPLRGLFSFGFGLHPLEALVVVVETAEAVEPADDGGEAPERRRPELDG